VVVGLDEVVVVLAVDVELVVLDGTDVELEVVDVVNVVLLWLVVVVIVVVVEVVDEVLVVVGLDEVVVVLAVDVELVVLDGTDVELEVVEVVDVVVVAGADGSPMSVIRPDTTFAARKRPLSFAPSVTWSVPSGAQTCAVTSAARETSWRRPEEKSSRPPGSKPSRGWT
jgi:hypothetical protein